MTDMIRALPAAGSAAAATEEHEYVPRAPSKPCLSHAIAMLSALLFPEYCSPPTGTPCGPPPGVSPSELPLVRPLPTQAETAALAREFAGLLTRQTLQAVLLEHWEKCRHATFAHRARAALSGKSPIDGSPLPPDADDDDEKMENHGSANGGRVLRVRAGVNTLPGDPLAPDVEAIRAEVETTVVLPLLQRLPKLSAMLSLDVAATLEQDVVAHSKSEVLLSYPGILCLIHQRFAHELLLLGAPSLLTRMITEIAHSATGIDIHAATTIGHSCFIDHGTGIVIGATAVIGNRVSIYQGVTLGARSFQRDKTTGKRIKHLPRHPIVEDDVTLYSHCTVLGRITIGKGAVIGGNVWVTADVKSREAVLQAKPSQKAIVLGVDGAGI